MHLPDTAEQVHILVTDRENFITNMSKRCGKEFLNYSDLDEYCTFTIEDIVTYIKKHHLQETLFPKFKFTEDMTAPVTGLGGGIQGIKTTGGFIVRQFSDRGGHLEHERVYVDQDDAERDINEPNYGNFEKAVERMFGHYISKGR